MRNQPNYLRDIPTPGDKIEFGDLTLRFLVDEDLTNYMEIQKWIRGLGFPESIQDFNKFEKEGQNNLPKRYAQFRRSNIFRRNTTNIKLAT